MNSKKLKVSNPNTLVVLLSRLLIVLSGLFLVYFSIQTKNQPLNIFPENPQKPEINDQYYFDTKYNAPTTTYQSIQRRTSNYYALPESIHLDLGQISNDINKFLGIDSNKLQYSGYDLECTDTIYKYDSEIQFGSVKSKNEYAKFKDMLLKELKINDSPENLTILVKMLCKDKNSQYIQFSIEKYFNKELSSFVKKANAAGGYYPETDDYLAILDLNHETDPIIMSLDPYVIQNSPPQNIVYSINQPTLDIQIQFSNSELRGVLDENSIKNLDTSYRRNISFRDMDIYPPFEENIFLSASRGGDGCGGDFSLIMLNVKSGTMNELFSCITGCPGYDVVCKNTDNEVYYKEPSHP